MLFLILIYRVIVTQDMSDLPRCNLFVWGSEAFGRVRENRFVEEKPDLVEVQTYFVRWMERYLAGRCVRLRKGSEFVFVRMVNRFQKKYKKAVLKRLNRLRGVKFQWFFTLTVNPRRFDFLADERS